MITPMSAHDLTWILPLAAIAVWVLYALVSLASHSRDAHRKIDGHYPLKPPAPYVPPAERSNWK